MLDETTIQPNSFKDARATSKSLHCKMVLAKPRRVNFELQKLKIEHLKNYFVDRVIDLAPLFQRGRVWKPKDRKGLIKNILQGKPVPAIFWYKTQSGPRNDIVILDGKQRLESILLFIGNQRADFSIPNWTDYIAGMGYRREHGFTAIANGKKKNLKQLSDDEIVKFRDYSLSIIEIDFDDETTLQEIVELFVDINQTGVKVTRFEIVKSLYREDPLLNQVLGFIAIPQDREKDIFYKSKSTAFVKVLKHLDIVKRVEDSQAGIDVMRERLFEFALFAQTSQHRKPSQILKDYISRKPQSVIPTKLDSHQVNLLKKVFEFLEMAGKKWNFYQTRMASEHTHFYILVTYLINEIRNVERAKIKEVLSDSKAQKIASFDGLFVGRTRTTNEALANQIRQYREISEKQTTDVKKRQDREQLVRDILNSL